MVMARSRRRVPTVPELVQTVRASCLNLNGRDGLFFQILHSVCLCERESRVCLSIRLDVSLSNQASRLVAAGTEGGLGGDLERDASVLGGPGKRFELASIGIGRAEDDRDA